MENYTYTTDYHLILFSSKSNHTLLTTVVFFLLYVFGVLINFTIIKVICIDGQLHTPMYIFLCNLALVDIGYTTTTVPNLLHMLLSADNTISFMQCFTQMYFYTLVGTTEDILIFIMAYDRYVAICHPLHYHTILNKKNCILFASSSWIIGSLNLFVFVIPVPHQSYCHSHTINNFVCDAKALEIIFCTKDFNIVNYMESLIFLVIPAMFCLTSYIKIIKVILQIKSRDGRKKAFSTCSSHLTVVIIYYTALSCAFMMPPSGSNNVQKQVFALLYSVVTPMLNPIIYCLRNKDVKKALMRLLGVKLSNYQ